MLVRNWVQQSLDEQVVDVDPDIMVVEGKEVRRTWCVVRFVPVYFEGKFLHFVRRTSHFGCEAVKEDRPALLEEGEKCLPIGNQGLKWPVVKGIVLAQKLDESPVEVSRDSLAVIVAAEQYSQKVGRLFDQLGRDFKNVP